MENQNKNAAAKVAANIEEERMHPIFEECEVMNAGKPAREHMLSMNGMYISGITDEQLKEMHEKLTELLTGEKPAKYFYGEGSIPLKNGDVFCKRDFVLTVGVIDDDGIAVACQPQGAGAPDAAGRAGYDCNFHRCEVSCV